MLVETKENFGVFKKKMVENLKKYPTKFQNFMEIFFI